MLSDCAENENGIHTSGAVAADAPAPPHSPPQPPPA